MISFEPCQQMVLIMKDSFGARLKFFRSKAGFSQQQLADKAGLSRKIISDYEVKLDIMPRETNLYKIADALNIDSSNLVPKTDLSQIASREDEDIELKIDLNEFPREFVEAIKSGAKKNNRSLDEEFNHVVSKAIDVAASLDKKQLIDDYENFDKRVDQQNEKLFKEYLNSK